MTTTPPLTFRPAALRSDSTPLAWVLDIGLVAICVALATAFRFALNPALGNLFPFATYSVFLILLGCLWNTRSGLLTLVTGLVFGSWFFIPPRGSLVPGTLGGWVGDGFYLLTNGIILWLSDRQVRARHLAESSADQARKAQERQRAEEQRWRALVEMITDAFVALDCECRYIYVNENAEKILGKTRGELLGKRVWDVFPDARELPSGRAIIAAAEDGRPRYVETHEAARESWYENSIYPSGEGVTVLFRDITERKRAESAIQTLNAELRERLDEREALLDILPVGVWTADPACNEIRGNRAAYEVMGLPAGINASFTAPAPEIPAGVKVVVDGVEVMGDDLPMQRVGRTGEALRGFTHELVFPDGERKVVLGSIAPVFDENGRVRQVIGAYADYTEKSRTETALRESEEAFRRLADSMPQIVWTARPDGSADYYNRRWTEFSGLSMEDGTGSGWRIPTHPDDVERTVEAWNRAVDSGDVYECEHRLRRADGQYRWLLSRAIPHKDADGGVIKWYGSATDIDDLKRAEELARQRTDEVERLNVRLRRAMAETHHRVKNNLQVITALVDLQVMSHEELVPVAELERIGQHIKALATIHDILTDSAKTSGDSDYVLTAVVMAKLAPLLQSIVGDRAIRFDVENVRLAVKQGTSLAVLVNEMISNAVKHGEGDIEVSLAVVNERALLAVADRGPGFGDDFDPRKAASTGLELIESIGRTDLQGATRYENLPEGGARVVVEFPRLPEAEAVPAAAGTVPAEIAPIKAGGPKVGIP